MRAIDEPMQRWPPRPKARCLLTARSMSTSSAPSNTDGSWLAATQLMNTTSPRRICLPPSSTSRVAVRVRVSLGL